MAFIYGGCGGYVNDFCEIGGCGMEFILHSPVFRGISDFKHRKTEHCVKRENEDDARQSDSVSYFPCGGRINGCKHYLVFILFRDNLITSPAAESLE